MKKMRIVSLVLIIAVIFSAFGAISAFATEDDVISNADLISGSDIIPPVVSATDHIATYQTYKLKIKPHRLTMTVPKLESAFSANSTNSALATALPESGYNLESIINFTDSYYSGDAISYLYSGSSANSSIMINILYSENNFTKYIGDYKNLDDEKLEDLRTTTLSFNGEYPEIRKINGNLYLYAEGLDESYGYYSYSLEAIINGGRYRIYIDISDPSPADYAVATEMIRSIKIGGLRPTLAGAADNALVIALLAAVIILFIMVCLLGFFIIRFSLFASAAGSRFNIVGFNMPPKKNELERFRRERERAERKTKEKAKKTVAADVDRTISLTDSISDD